VCAAADVIQLRPELSDLLLDTSLVLGGYRIHVLVRRQQPLASESGLPLHDGRDLHLDKQRVRVGARLLVLLDLIQSCTPVAYLQHSAAPRR